MKKKINIGLLILVMSLWGTVIFKYVSQYFLKGEQLVVNTNESNFTNSNFREKDTFELKNLKRDPFLNKMTSFVVKKSRPYFTKKAVVKPPVVVIQKYFPTITYLGYIGSSEKEHDLALIKVNGRLLKLKANEGEDELKMVKIHKDSIQVSFAGTVQNIRNIRLIK